MRYHYEKPHIYLAKYGITHISDHPVYTRSTLYLIGDNGLSVIQQRYDEKTKHTWWGELDPWLIDDLYLSPRFRDVFNDRSGQCTDGLYPTITLRQLMWALKMKPIKRERWETCFDRKDI